MQARIQIWVQPGRPLVESEWIGNGYPTLEDYVDSLENESRAGYKKNGKAADTDKHLPLVSFGLFDAKTGEKITVMVCPTIEDLPVEDLEYNGAPIIKFKSE